MSLKRTDCDWLTPALLGGFTEVVRKKRIAAWNKFVAEGGLYPPTKSKKSSKKTAKSRTKKPTNKLTKVSSKAQTKR
jgi:hypothetical protein